MKKILQINVNVNSGSTGRIAEEIGKKIISNGWESFIGYGRIHTSSKSTVIKIGTKKDFYLHALSTRLLDTHGLFSKNATRNFINEVRKIQPDIIHLHNIHGYYINYPLLFAYLVESQIPVVWTMHDCWAFTGHCSFFSFEDCQKWKNHCFNCPLKASYPASLFIDRSFKNFHSKKKYFSSVDNLTIVPVCNWLKNLISKSYFSPTTCKTIHNGLDTTIFSPFSVEEVEGLKNKMNISNKYILLGVANVWTSRKGIDDFIRLSKILDQNFMIILIGLSKTQINNLPPNIIGLTRTENLQELIKYYSLANIFINPTREDTFPTTNLEAMACGTPVISYDTGGCNEAIDKNTGFVIPQGDIQKVKDAIDFIIYKGKEAYSQFCIEKVQNYFNKEKQYQKYIDIYEQILNK